MPEHLVAIVLADVALIVLCARAAGALFERYGQPSVIGEIVAGIVLGPTVLGAISGDLPTAIFPTDVRPVLTVVGQLGLVLFMFVVGLELDLGKLRRRRVVGIIATGSVLVPFGVGIAIAPLLWSEFRPAEDVGYLAFALFSGVAFAITAFPVLARILLDRGLARTELGVLGLACAAVNDVAGWIVLAVVLAVISADGTGDVVLAVAGTAAFAAGLLLVARPGLLGPLERRRSRAGVLEPGVVAVAIAAILGAAYVTERVGTHALLGAFLVGLAWPRDATAAAQEIRAQIEPLTRRMLLPVFFALPGLAIDLRDLDASAVGVLALVLLGAIGGKLLGAAGGARIAGFSWRSSAAVGILMNTRGLVELIVLNVGLEAGVLTPELYSVLVVMAVVTTMMTGPLIGRMGIDGVMDHVSARAPRRAVLPPS